MKSISKNQSGLAHVIDIAVVVIVLVTLFAVFKTVKNHQRSAISKPQSAQTQSTKTATLPKPQTEVSWHLVGKDNWQATGTPPTCPDQPIFATPVDISLATSIIYPGQVRGNAFKPHGGFRFDNQSNNDITLTVPMDAKLMRGAKGLFPEQGEVQYGFEFIAPCGIWYAFGHIHTLSPQFQSYADKLPLISDMSKQQFYDIDGSPTVKKDDVIATQVGIIHTKNVFVEWQVDDLRQKNGKTIRPVWSQYSDQFDPHGVCWLDMLPTKDAVLAKALRGGDSVSGKESDYCN